MLRLRRPQRGAGAGAARPSPRATRASPRSSTPRSRTSPPPGAGAGSRPRRAPTADEIAAVDRAITTRRSVRAFLPTPVPRATVEEILAVASRAPSGTNTQPWHVHVVAGERKARAVGGGAARARPRAGRAHRGIPLLSRCSGTSPTSAGGARSAGSLYGLVGIERGDKAGMHRQHGRNYLFFDAPVGLFFTIDRGLERGSWLDYGMFLQNVMVAARARGLDTCPQAAFLKFHRVIARELALPDERDAGVRDVAGLRRSRRAREPPRHRAGAGRRRSRASWASTDGAQDPRRRARAAARRARSLRRRARHPLRRCRARAAPPWR